MRTQSVSCCSRLCNETNTCSIGCMAGGTCRDSVKGLAVCVTIDKYCTCPLEEVRAMWLTSIWQPAVTWYACCYAMLDGPHSVSLWSSVLDDIIEQSGMAGHTCASTCSGIYHLIYDIQQINRIWGRQQGALSSGSDNSTAMKINAQPSPLLINTVCIGSPLCPLPSFFSLH